MTERWTVLKILRWSADYLSGKGIDSPRLDAELLLARALGLDRVGLYLNYDRPLDEGELAAYRALMVRRARREPLAYILGSAEFWSLPMRVMPGVLIPRSDTEVLVEEALRLLPDQGRVLDVGTGTGAIAIAIASERPGLRLEGLDISPVALEVARENALNNGVADRVEFRSGDLAELPAGPYQMVVSNPPYIPTADMEGLMPDVRDFEPHLALDGGEDGLRPYRLLAAQASVTLAPGGWLIVEVGIGQASEVEELFAAAGLEERFTRADYAGVQRVVGARRAQA